MNNIISYDYCGIYSVQFDYVIKKTTKCKIINSTLSKEEKIALGEQYSPKELSIEFKYLLGNYIDCLNKGSNILLSINDKYGCLSELQIEILEKLGYNFIFVNLNNDNHISIIKMYQFAKRYNSKLNVVTYMYYLIQGLLMIIIIKKLSKKVLNKSIFKDNKEVSKKILNKIQKAYLKDNLSICKIIKIYYIYSKQIKTILLKNKEIE